MKEIRVLMLGGKRCGKTTVLSSMYSSINATLAGTGLSLNVEDPSTQSELNRAMRAIVESMEQFKKPLTSCEVDDNPTSAERSYSFSLRREGKGGGIPFRIHDIPGEWLVDQNAAKVKELIGDCQVILIAIDTPYLFARMTDKGYGQYHEQYNKPIEITNFFKNSLSIEDLRDRMILFVPIKCERYYHLDRSAHLRGFGRRYMQEMTQAVGAGYRDLILYLRSTEALMDHCTIAITPILSAGGIDFISFRQDPQTGKMISYYQAPEFLKEEQIGYHPMFCAQPMIYILTYLLIQACDEQQRKSSLFQFGSSLMSGMNLAQMQAAIDTLQKRMKRNSGLMAQDDGYLFIQNPRRM
nr:hypothetical protein [uncultured Acetatifactor sp.]